MATHRGSEGEVYLDTNRVAEVNEWGVDETLDTVDDSELSDDNKSHLRGQGDSQGFIDCHWDETDTNGQESLTLGAIKNVKLCPEGYSPGDKYYYGAVIVTGISISGRKGDTVRRRFTMKPVAGLLQYGIVPS